MIYRVLYGPSFRDDIREHVGWLRRQQVSERVIERWYDRLFELVGGLNTWPRRYPIDTDYDDGTGHHTHKINFGDYLVFFEVDDERQQVDVVAFVHGARRG